MAEATIVLATRNPGKVRELAVPLAAFGLTVVGLDAFPDLPDVEETGTTFAANALLKADAVARATGLVAVADDSGLAVDALAGAPGVRSARYWQTGDVLGALTAREAAALSQDERNNRKLLLALAAVPDAARGASFHCAMCAVRPLAPGVAPAPARDCLVAEGAWRGRILDAPRGDGGFGYDPLFFDEALQCSAAEMPREVKMRRSHRALALERLLTLWPEWMQRAHGDAQPPADCHASSAP